MKKLTLLLTICCYLSTQAAITINKASGWLETAYAEWAPLSGYTDYNAYVRPAGGTYTLLDKPLLRNYGTYLRVDALGLQAGQYQLKIVAVDTLGNEVSSTAIETANLTVAAHDRNGYAHFGLQGIGAYNDNGTLKQGAKVFYVTRNTARTISTSVTIDSRGTQQTYTGMQAILEGYEKGYDTTPIVFRIVGAVGANDMDALGSSAEGLQVKGRRADSELNLTIEGVGNDAVLQGFGILVRNSKSVELRNFAVMTLMDDCISLDTDNDHVWIHHIDGFYGPNKGGDQKKGDGTIDVKGNSKHVTVSYNHFWDTGKSSMCGMHQDSGPNYITYHHNWFDHSDSRHPRIRTMSVHIYNNYFDGNAKYCVGATSASSVFVENNYFNNCPKPMLISKQGTDVHNGVGASDDTKGTFSGEAGGIIKAYNNTFVGNKTYVAYSATANTHFDAYEVSSRTATVPATVTALLGGHTYNNFDTDPTLIYNVTPDAPAQVPAIVTGDQGAGRCEHGDVQFTFTNADNADYEINTALAALITGYHTSLVNVLGEQVNTTPGDSTGNNPSDTTIIVTPSNYECHFMENKPSNNFYTVSGNYSNSKGSFEINGTTYSVCLKMESSTQVSFTTTAPMELFLGMDNGGNIKVDGTKLSANGQIIRTNLAAGSHTLTKGDSHYLFYINLTANDTTDTSVDYVGADALSWDGKNILNPAGAIVRLYTISGNCLGTTTDDVISTEYLPQGQYIAVSTTGALKFVK